MQNYQLNTLRVQACIAKGIDTGHDWGNTEFLVGEMC